jgi:hypothetical protein
MDLPDLEQYLKDGRTNDLKLEVLWDKYNSGLLCTKIFTLVDKYNLLADVKIVSANSIELLVTLASAAAGGVAGAVAKELISYLFKRKQTNPDDLHKTVIIINDQSININALYEGADKGDLLD